MGNEIKFVDIMLPRRTESGIFQFMTRSWNGKRTLEMDKYFTPQELKEIAANSDFIDAVIEAESAATGVDKAKLKTEIVNYLEEMGLDKKMYVIRWMGVVFLKISFMMKIGVFVNEAAVLNLRSTMGKNPVLFLPTHRSYADFCLMTYLCYHYDIEFPAVAAGMDFYSMAVVGRSMRDTCAFYIRRTLSGAPLYAATLQQYARTLVAKHCAPIEFFIEGTRSRSNKTLPPKFGMLSMCLLPLFAGEVSDITIVPVNISYDRLMEHGLFAYEHLGVPKPKESTGGLLKALYHLNSNFGNIYINLGQPLSVKQYIQAASQSKEILKPIHMQQLSNEQFAIVQDIANDVVTLQQQCTVATITNLVSLVLMQSIIQNTPKGFEEVLDDIEWVMVVLRKLGTSVFENDVRGSVERILVVHSGMMKIDKGHLKLLPSDLMNISEEVKKKIKGHTLLAETMVNAVSVIQLQLYVNPVLHCLAPAALLALLVHQGSLHAEQLRAQYDQLRKLLKHEFFYADKAENNIFDGVVAFCVENNVLSSTEGSFSCGSDEKMRFLLKWCVWPALTTVVKCADVMREQHSCEHKRALTLIQERIESSHCHPYCLSLESIGNCLQGLVLAGALIRGKRDDEVTYEVVPSEMEQSYNLVNEVLPRIRADFGKENSVIIDRRIIPSRL